MRSNKLTKLRREYAIISGMTDEITMSCLLLRNKIEKHQQESEERGYDREPPEELYHEVMSKMAKFDRKLNKYRKRMSRIVEELKEINGTSKF